MTTTVTVEENNISVTLSDGVSPSSAQLALLQTLATISGLANFNGSGSAGAILIKLNGTAAPTVNDDSGDGYGIGSLWIDTTNDNIYQATDVTVGAANWEQINGSGGGAVDSVFGRTGAVVAVDDDYALSQIADDSALAKSSAAAAVNTLATSVEGLETVTQAHYNATTSVHGIADTSALLTTGAIGSTVQAYSAKTAAIAALTWAANSIILLTGTTTASVQALASHVITFLQSANAAAARTAIGAGTGSGDVTGPASSTDNAIARYDSTTGKLLQGSTATVDDNGSVTLGPGNSTINSRLIYFPNSAGTVMSEIQVAGGILRLFPYGGYGLHLGTDGNILIYLTTTSRVGIGKSAPDGKLHVWDTGGGFLQKYASGVVGSATSIIPNGTGDVTLCLSGTFTISDGAGNTAGGVITKTAPSGTFNLYDDGGTNTCQLQVAADGSVTVIRTAGSRTYAVNLQLNWM